MLKLNSYDRGIIRDIEAQFPAVHDAKGNLVRPETNVAKAIFGTVSIAAEAYLTEKEGYTVVNRTPFCTVTKPE